MNQQWFDEFERALGMANPVDHLRAVVVDLVQAGSERDLVQAQLDTFRAELRAQNRDADEDVVLDVLDFLTGWSSPQMRIE